MKVLIRLFIALFIFLSSGYGQLYAHNHQDDNFTAPIQNLKWMEQEDSDTLSSCDTTLIGIPHHYIEKENVKLRPTDDEGDEDEITTLKNYLGAGNYFATIFYNQTPGYFSQNIKSCLPFSKHFSYFSSDRYIKFRVLRLWSKKRHWTLSVPSFQCSFTVCYPIVSATLEARVYALYTLLNEYQTYLTA